MLPVCIGPWTVWGLAPHEIRSLVGCSPNAGAHLLPEAGAQRRLEAVRFRVKAPVPRRPPHRSGRAGFPHPVPREPAACVTGSPHRRHPVWRIPLLALARRDGTRCAWGAMLWSVMATVGEPSVSPRGPSRWRDARRRLPSRGSLGTSVPHLPRDSAPLRLPMAHRGGVRCSLAFPDPLGRASGFGSL